MMETTNQDKQLKQVLNGIKRLYLQQQCIGVSWMGSWINNNIRPPIVRSLVHRSWIISIQDSGYLTPWKPKVFQRKQSFLPSCTGKTFFPDPYLVRFRYPAKSERLPFQEVFRLCGIAESNRSPQFGKLLFYR